MSLPSPNCSSSTALRTAHVFFAQPFPLCIRVRQRPFLMSFLYCHIHDRPVKTVSPHRIMYFISKNHTKSDIITHLHTQYTTETKQTVTPVMYAPCPMYHTGRVFSFLRETLALPYAHHSSGLICTNIRDRRRSHTTWQSNVPSR